MCSKLIPALGRNTALLVSLVPAAIGFVGCTTDCPTPYVAVRVPDTDITISVTRAWKGRLVANRVRDLMVFRNNELLDSVPLVPTEDARLNLYAVGADDVVVRASLGREYRIRVRDGRIDALADGDEPALPTTNDTTFLGAFDFDWFGNFQFIPASSRTERTPHTRPGP